MIASRLPGPVLVRAWDRGLGACPPGADVVHATSLAVPPSGPAPMTVMVHDLAWRHEPERLPPPRGGSWHEAALGRARDRAAVARGAVAATADDLVAAGVPAGAGGGRRGGLRPPAPGRTTAPPPAAGPAWACPGGYLLTVSTLEPRKNLPRLLAAYALALPALPRAVAAGGGGPGGLGAGAAAAGGPTVSARRRGRRRRAVRPLRRRPAAGLRARWSRGSACRRWRPCVRAPGGGQRRCRAPAGPRSRSTRPTWTPSPSGLVAVATDERLRAELVAAGRGHAGGLTWEAAARRHVELWTTVQEPPPGRLRERARRRLTRRHAVPANPAGARPVRARAGRRRSPAATTSRSPSSAGRATAARWQATGDDAVVDRAPRRRPVRLAWEQVALPRRPQPPAASTSTTGPTTRCPSGPGARRGHRPRPVVLRPPEWHQPAKVRVLPRGHPGGRRPGRRAWSP